MALVIATWLWGGKWGGHYVDRLFAGVGRHLRQPYRTLLITDRSGVTADTVCGIEPDDHALLALPGCLVRVRMFDARWQASVGIQPGDRVVNVDVDAVITGALDPLFDRPDAFTILQHVNSTNPCPFNGSLWMFRGGERHDVWNDFSIEASRKVPYHAIPDDQGWLHHKFPDAAAWTAADGVYAFKKKTWPGKGHALPANARIVAFPGRDPGKFLWLDWVRTHWAT